MIPFLQLTPGEDATAVRGAVERVITRGWFVLGPEVDAFEREFAAASGAGLRHQHLKGQTRATHSNRDTQDRGLYSA